MCTIQCGIWNAALIVFFKFNTAICAILKMNKITVIIVYIYSTSAAIWKIIITAHECGMVVFSLAFVSVSVCLSVCDAIFFESQLN